jgi:hypothetical protein
MCPHSFLCIKLDLNNLRQYPGETSVRLTAGNGLVMDVETHTMRGIDPFCKLVEEEDELNLLP